MLQLLVWAVCALIIGVGYCGMHLARISSKKEDTKGIGNGFLGFGIIVAILIFIISFVESMP